MNAVWKFGPLTTFGDEERDAQLVDMPAAATVVHAALQDGRIYLWADVNTTAPKVTRGFLIFGTGWPIPVRYRYVATVLDGPFVWHVYESPR